MKDFTKNSLTGKNTTQLNNFKEWLRQKNFTNETIKNYLGTVNQYGTRKIDTNSISNFLRENLIKRSLATNLYNLGGKLETIQKQLGHSSLDTTLGYIHNDYQTLYADYSKLWTTKSKEF